MRLFWRSAALALFVAVLAAWVWLSEGLPQGSLSTDRWVALALGACVLVGVGELAPFFIWGGKWKGSSDYRLPKAEHPMEDETKRRPFDL